MSSTTTLTCANHPDVPVVSFCRTCGKPLCAACRRPVADTIFCEEHVPAVASPGTSSARIPRYSPPVADSPYTAPPPSPRTSGIHASPALAILLGFIPGVGAIYNGQYAKGLVHAVTFGLLVTAISSHSLHGFEPLLGILIGVFVFYMAIEAYHTARKRESGEPIEEFSSLIGVGDSGFPTGAIILIGLGFLLLLNTLDLISMEAVLRFWPAALILIGVYMLYSRLKGGTQ
jgi:Domain of unknown function (DUF5668)/B-box zinc finger